MYADLTVSQWFLVNPQGLTVNPSNITVKKGIFNSKIIMIKLYFVILHVNHHNA